jgi:hypothetical protein
MLLDSIITHPLSAIDATSEAIPAILRKPFIRSYVLLSPFLGKRFQYLFKGAASIEFAIHPPLLALLMIDNEKDCIRNAHVAPCEQPILFTRASDTILFAISSLRSTR